MECYRHIHANTWAIYSDQPAEVTPKGSKGIVPQMPETIQVEDL